MPTNTQQQTDLGITTQRSAQINADLTVARAALEQAHQGYLTGKTNSEELATHESRVTALQKAADAIGQRVTELEADAATDALTRADAAYNAEIARINSAKESLQADFAQQAGATMQKLVELLATFQVEFRGLANDAHQALATLGETNGERANEIGNQIERLPAFKQMVTFWPPLFPGNKHQLLVELLMNNKLK